MAAHEERAYASIYRWVHHQSSQLQPESAASIRLLHKGVACLSSRPTLLAFCLKELATCRRQPLQQARHR